jgi:Bacterial membrane protein YfhO
VDISALRVKFVSLLAGGLTWARSHQHISAAILLIVCELVLYRYEVFGQRTFLLPECGQTMPMSQGGGAYGYVRPGERAGLHVRDPWAVEGISIPIQYYSRQTMLAGELPLWNRHECMGQSHVGSGEGGVFEPIQLLSYLAPRNLWMIAMDATVLIRYLLAGFFTYLFLRQLRLGFWPALISGTAFLMCNRFLDTGNHPQLRVESLLPLFLYALERLAREWNWRTSLLTAGGVLWILLADFPEPEFMVLSFGCFWYAWRSLGLAWTSKAFGRMACSLSVRLFLALAAGFALAAPVVLPFLENVGISDSVHVPGSVHGGYALEGLIWTLVPFWTKSYFRPVYWFPHYAMVIVFLAVGGLLRSLRARGNLGICSFFGLYFLVFFSRSYGTWPGAWISELPIYGQVLGVYATPMLEFCLIVLAALGIEWLLAREIWWPWHAGIGLGILGLLGVMCLQVNVPPRDMAAFLNVLGKVCLFVTILAGCCVAAWFWRPGRTVQALTVLGLVVFEACYWQGYVRRGDRYDIYREAPFVEFLKRQERDARIFADDGILMPNASMAYGIDDIRFINALNSERRVLFSRSFLCPRDSCGLMRFCGCEKAIYHDRYMDLANVRYIVTTRGMPPRTEVRFADDPHDEKVIAGAGCVQLLSEEVDRRERHKLRMNGPGEVRLPMPVPVGHSRLQLSCCAESTGAPVQVRAEVCGGTRSQVVWQATLAAANRTPGESYQAPAADLSQWSGADIEVVLRAEAPNAAAVVWDMPLITVEDSPHYWSEADKAELLSRGSLASASGMAGEARSGKYDLVYDREGVQIYRNRWAFPRAFVVHSVECAADMEAAVRRLKEPDFDPSRHVVIDGERPQDWDPRLFMSGEALAPVPATVVSQTANSMTVRATADYPGLLVASETYAPGWEAYVDGRPAHIYPAYVTMRAVYLEEGTHTIEFVYRPKSFMVGLALAASAATAILIGLAFPMWRRLRRTTGTDAAATGMPITQPGQTLPL